MAFRFHRVTHVELHFERKVLLSEYNTPTLGLLAMTWGSCFVTVGFFFIGWRMSNRLSTSSGHNTRTQAGQVQLRSFWKRTLMVSKYCTFSIIVMRQEWHKRVQRDLARSTGVKSHTTTQNQGSVLPAIGFVRSGTQFPVMEELWVF
jgi:hypothetical protein